MPTPLFTRPARRSRPARAIAGAAPAVSMTLGVAACGNDDPSSDSSASVDAAADHNEADVRFASEMLVHHAQAIEMVDLTEGRDLSPPGPGPGGARQGRPGTASSSAANVTAWAAATRSVAVGPRRSSSSTRPAHRVRAQLPPVGRVVHHVGEQRRQAVA